MICPHFKTFIRDQVNSIAPFFSSVAIMMPLPYFCELIIKIPYFNEKFKFIKITLDSLHEVRSEKIMFYSHQDILHYLSKCYVKGTAISRQKAVLEQYLKAR